MKKKGNHLATPAFLIAVLLAAGLAAPALADSACKGLEQRQCDGKGDCTWVDGYTRKDGVKVSAHCKAVGKKGSTSSKQKKDKQEG
jgi:hypothetical protein